MSAQSIKKKLKSKTNLTKLPRKTDNSINYEDSPTNINADLFNPAS
jgi:hypothetical protein